MKEQIKRAMEDEELRKKLRNNAWQVIKNYTYPRMAKKFESLYNQVMYPGITCASVIIAATYDSEQYVRDIIAALDNQSHKNIDAIVVWDEVEKKPIDIKSRISVKQLFTGRDGYNLAMARNLGVIESIGEIIVICDSRLKPEPDAIKCFVDELTLRGVKEKVWLFGEKGGGKDTFVENFSAIRRTHLIRGGMFCERVNRYGGMSQELRSRFNAQGFEFKYLPEAQAEQIKGSKLTSERRQDIIASKDLLYKLISNK
jgi:glycosyltransferase involved in cell wall biosynthesis